MKSVNVWERFARENAPWYILTEERFRNGADLDAFYSSGEESTETLYGRVAGLLPGHGRAVEIGCGLGRLTLPHGRKFEEVYGVDISATMLQRLRERDGGSGRIKTFLPEEEWDEENSADYCYSVMVFQHIAHEQIITGYLERIAKALKRGGIAQLHFDTRPATFSYHLRNRLPDLLLPRSQRLGLRRIRRKREDLLALFTRLGLILQKELNPNSPHQVFILKKS